MRRDLIDAVGYTAAILTTVSFVPQVIRCWRSRSAGDLSVFMLLLFAAGVSLWLVYGVALSAFPVIAANGVTLVLTMVLLALRFRFGRG